MANSRNYRVPTKDDKADVPYWNDLLAQDVAKDVDKLEAGAEILEGKVLQESIDTSVSFAVVDEMDNASWIASTADGRMPPHSVEVVVEQTSGAIGEAVRGEIGLVDDPKVALSGESYTIVDEDDNRSEFGLDPQGRISQRTIDAIIARIPRQEAGILGLALVGDSVTESLDQYNGGVKWPQLLGDALGVPVWNGARSGEATADIALRSGALGVSITLAGNSIPAGTTPVSVTAISPSDGYRNVEQPNSYGIGEFIGVLAGIAGKLANASGTWTFTRTTAGSAVTVPAGSKFYMQAGKAHRQDVWIIWSGHNGGDVARDVKTIIDFLAAPKRYLVLSLLTNNAWDSTLQGLAGANYFDIRQWLITNGLAAAGVTPTAQDNTDIANGVVPSSLRIDNVHPNANGNVAIAKALTDTIKSKGWATR